MSLKVFVSYAKEDRNLALEYYDLLVKAGTSPWIDIKHLLPGQNWEAEIEKAFSDAHVVVLLLSNKSVSKRGFVQREANDAIDRLRYKQPTDIYVIPLLLEPCEVPSHIAGRLQYVDLNTSGAWDQVCASLKLAAEQQSLGSAQGVNVGLFNVFTERIEEQWKGFPGHDIKIEYPRFESFTRPDLAKELSLLFGGRAMKVLIESRQKPWNQSPESFSDIESSFSMNGRWDDFGIVYATDRLLSITYDVGWYGAGAAHPNSHFETYNFCIYDHLQTLTLDDFFTDSLLALKTISSFCISSLCREYWARTGEKPDDYQINWFKNGAGESFDNFAAFTVGPDHFTFLFAPYQVGAYAFGRWSVDVYFYDLLDVLKADGPHQLAAAI